MLPLSQRGEYVGGCPPRMQNVLSAVHHPVRRIEKRNLRASVACGPTSLYVAKRQDTRMFVRVWSAFGMWHWKMTILERSRRNILRLQLLFQVQICRWDANIFLVRIPTHYMDSVQTGGEMDVLLLKLWIFRQIGSTIEQRKHADRNKTFASEW
jgi:hypothetical protein